MNNQDWERFGEEIRRTVQDAVDSKDYRRLNQTITNTINQAMNEVSRTMRNMGNGMGRKCGPYGPGWQNPPYGKQEAPVKNSTENSPVLYNSTTGTKVGGILLCAFGYPFAVVSGFLLIICIAGLFLMDSGEVIGLIVLFGILTAVFGVMAGCGTSKLKRVGRFNKYLKMIQGREYCDIKELAQNAGKTTKYVAKDVMKMIEKGWFCQGHLDSKKSCLMVTNRAYDQYLQLEEQMKEKERDDIYRRQQKEKEDRLQNEKEKQKKEKEEKARSGLSREVREIVEQGDAYIQKIHECNDAIPGEEISAKISRMEMLVDRIFDRVEQNPETVSDIRKLMDYYLPTTIKLLEAYEELDRQPVGGENIKTAKAEIEATLDTLNIAFEKLLDSLFQNTAWDVSSDISVLHTMLAQEGLTEDGMKQKK